MLPSYIKFQAQNIRQIKKTKIKVTVNIVAHINFCKATRFAVDNWYDMTINIGDNNDETNIDFTNVNLVEFRVHTKTLLVDNVQELCQQIMYKKFVIDK